MDVSKLTDEQLEIASKVAAEATKQGINPDYVLPMVMAESGMSHGRKSAVGAAGVMQLMEKTAKEMGVDSNDVDQNIAGGVKYIKQLTENPYIGNDPYKVLVGYNAGPNSKFFSTGNIQDLPDETLNHIAKVHDYYGGDLPSVLSGEPTEPNKPMEQQSEVAPQEVPTTPSNTQNQTWPYAVVGGATGAGVAGTLEAAKKGIPLGGRLLRNLAGTQPSMTTPVDKTSLQRYLNSQIPAKIRMPLSELEKVTGSEIRTMSEVQNALKAIQEVKPERVAKTASIDPRTGTARKIYTTTPGRAAVDLSAYEHTPTIGTKIVDEAKRGVGMVKGALPSVGRVGAGALGGLTAGSQLYDAFDQYGKEGGGYHVPSFRNAAKFASGAGGALGMLPFGITQGLGLALQAPEVMVQGYDAISNLKRDTKNATRDQVERMQNIDPMGSALP